MTLANTSQKLRTPLGAILNSEITNTEAQKCRGKKVALNRPTQREPAYRPKSERRRQGTASSDPGRARVGQESISSAPLRPGHDPDGPARLTWGYKHIPASRQVCKMRKYSFREERGSTVMTVVNQDDASSPSSGDWGDRRAAFLHWRSFHKRKEPASSGLWVLGCIRVKSQLCT